MRRYVRSMIKNHLNKAPELNGGVRPSGRGTATFTTKKADKVPSLDRSALSPGLAAALDAFTGVEE